MRKMKDSGIAWIGEIPEEWQVRPARYAFSEIRTKNTDGAITTALKFFNGTITPKTNFDAESDNYVADTITNYTIVYPDTIMINGLNLNYDLKSLRVGLVKKTGVITSAYLALWPDRSLILPEYATYLFKGYETRMAFHNMGAGIRKTLGYKEFKQQPIIFPTIPEQHRIAAFLDEKCAHIDAVIEKTRASIDEYKKLKQAIITRAVTKGLRQGRKMKDSGIEWIGEIPEEWDICYVSRLVKNTQNGLTRRDFGKSDGNIVLKLKNITKDGNIDYEFQNRIQLTNREKEIYRLQEGDFLFVRVNGSKDLVGKNAIFKDIGEIVAFNDHIIRVKINDQICDLNYFHWYLLSSCGKSQIELHTATAAGQYTINSEGIKDIRILIPELSEQQEIAAYLDAKTAAIDRLIAKKEQLAAEMESCKKSLIYEVVTGKREAAI